LDVPLGVSMITDVLFTSPILHGEDAGGAAGHVPADGSAGMVVDGPGGPVAGGGQFAEFGGINPDMDPELAMALKVSMEEERARQGGAGEEEAKPAEEKPATEAPQAEPATAPAQEAPAEEEEHDEQYYLDQAIKLSMQEEEQPKKEEEKPKEE